MKINMLSVAVGFATEWHEGQVRKYTGEAYINHPIEVMNIVRSVPHTQEMLYAALMHDCVEDTECSFSDIEDVFGTEVALLVGWLTDVSLPGMGNRAKRKEIDRKHTSKAPASAKTIKLADLISNSKSILEHDKDFAKVYIKEKELLLEVLTEGDSTLYAQAKDIVEKAKIELEIK